ncbi:hypothetical protein MHJ95_07775 [Corynebacterium imitans]|uniref:hypothetical protein n=1 Tax=Corynebacterium imitans TaxID=156978 RepID=UPI001EF225E3|nr:hypothetical protein [Corynebacterium imitans]MCG7278879.1 hypothetical protein [Corynebacterium imitans]MDK8307359.1 hypothetical protein [Corynebacterium imitans]MDK8638559.1 hypothetical protein [Corynebacterium imitans]MDK8773391.1 hypothetical protein [Corynebacterium imitans]
MSSAWTKTKDGRKNPQAFLTIFSLNQPVKPGNPRTQGTITTPLEWEQKASPDKRSGNGPKPKVRPEHPSVVFAAHVETAAGLELPADFISQLASAAHEVDGIVARFAEALDKVVSA